MSETDLGMWKHFEPPQRKPDVRARARSTQPDGNPMGPHAVTGRDAARDELLSEIADATDEWDAIQNSVTRETWEGTQHEHLADWLLSRGYRRSVTPAETERAGEAIADYVSGLRWGTEAARAAFRSVGLEVTE